MTDGTRIEDIKDSAPEVLEISESRAELDQATFEPETAVEKTASDFQQAEEVEAAVKESLEITQPAAEGRPVEGETGREAPAPTEDGGRETEEAAVPAADGGPEAEDGSKETGDPMEGIKTEDTGSGLSADEGPEIKSDDRQNQSQRLVQGQGGRALDLGSAGTSTEDIQRESNEQVIELEGAPRSDSNENPPPPESEDSGVAPSAPPISNAGEGNYTAAASENIQMVQDQIAGQTTAVTGAVQSLEDASDAVEQIAETLDELTEDQPEVDRSDDSAGNLREEPVEELGQSNSTADRGSFSSSLSAAQKVSAGSAEPGVMGSVGETIPDDAPGAIDEESFEAQDSDPNWSGSVVEVSPGEVDLQDDWDEHRSGRFSAGEEPEAPVPAGADRGKTSVNELKELLKPFRNNLGSLRQMVSDQMEKTSGEAGRPVTGSVVISEGSPQLEDSADGLGDALLSQFLKLNAVSPSGAADGLPLDGVGVQEAVEGDESTGELLMNYRDTIKVLQSDLEKLEQLLINIQNSPEGTQPSEVSTIHLPVKSPDGSYQLIEMPLPLDVGAIESMIANLQGQIIKIAAEIEILES